MNDCGTISTMTKTACPGALLQFWEEMHVNAAWSGEGCLLLGLPWLGPKQFWLINMWKLPSPLKILHLFQSNLCLVKCRQCVMAHKDKKTLGTKGLSPKEDHRHISVKYGGQTAAPNTKDTQRNGSHPLLWNTNWTQMNYTEFVPSLIITNSSSDDSTRALHSYIVCGVLPSSILSNSHTFMHICRSTWNIMAPKPWRQIHWSLRSYIYINEWISVSLLYLLFHKHFARSGVLYIVDLHF